MSANKYQTNLERIKELIQILNEADIAYYRDSRPIMTDFDYDRLFDELKGLERDTGLILSNSPTQKVSGEILEELIPVRHSKPMLSADKTKSIEDMVKFADKKPVVLSWKLDGLTLVLRYENGELKQAITRGREGIIGEDVTHNEIDDRFTEACQMLDYIEYLVDILTVGELDVRVAAVNELLADSKIQDLESRILRIREEEKHERN